MITPKIEALHRLIDWLNVRLNEKSKMSKLGLDKSEIKDNPLLTGFIQAVVTFILALIWIQMV